MLQWLCERTYEEIRKHFWITTVKQRVLGSCDRASWAKYEERKTNKMQQLDVYY